MAVRTQFEVTFEAVDKREVITVEAETPHLAAKLASRQSTLPIRSVCAIYTAVGTCDKCGAIMFDTDVARSRGGRPRCSACP